MQTSKKKKPFNPIIRSSLVIFFLGLILFGFYAFEPVLATEGARFERTVPEENQELDAEILLSQSEAAKVYYKDFDPQSFTQAQSQAFKNALHERITRNIEYLSYDESWEALAYINEDPARPGWVRTIYTGWIIPAEDHGSDPTGWNREHVWAKSHGQFGTRKGPGTDLFNLLPCDVTVNSARNNLDFDWGGKPYIDSSPPKNLELSKADTSCLKDSNSWQVRAQDRGDVARILFYMAVRYEGSKSDPYDPVDLELNELDSNETEAFMGKLSVLLEWNKEDPVDSWEQLRNERTYEIQKNRNPFVDHPEWVERIWF